VTAAAAPAPRPPESLSARNFARLSDFVHEYSGIKMPPAKKTMLEGRLRRRVRDCGLASLDAYCAFLFDRGGLEEEAVHLIDAVTTNKTDFFREPAHFEYLEAHALPALRRDGARVIRAWSAACSIGAEPYTLAMVLDTFCEANRGWDYAILGTDLCTQVLGQAQRAIYPHAMIEPVPLALRKRHVLLSQAPGRDEVRIAPHLRAKVGFARLNLMDDRYAAPRDLDLIFCRNILIYFDKATQAVVLRRLCSHLRPGGYLFLGHSETIVGVDLPVRTVANTVFQRI
jgi:chemotaxis protein methyltransferase CheR